MDASTNMSAIDDPAAAAPDGAPDAAGAAEAAPVPPPLPFFALPAPASPRAKPVGEEDRFITLDVVRGVALCGILLVNMENFAMVREARYDPALGGGDSALDHLVWLGTYLFADGKFIAIFTMLFGAGIAVANDRRIARAARGAWAVHYRRMLFLLVVGAAHGIYLWRGDILYFYAFWGLWLYFAPRIPAPVLAVAGLGLYAYFVRDFSEQLLGGVDGYSWWEREIYQGGWHMQYGYRMQSEQFYLTRLPIEFATHLIGLMLFGMALFKSGFLSGRWPTWTYFVSALITLPLGVRLVVDGTSLTTGFAGLFEAKEFVWGGLLLSIGYMSEVIALTKAIGPRFGLGAFAAIGRMAFTNYLMQTLICTTLFYGWGFGLFERTTRGQQLGIVVAICAFQMVFSLVWLRFFRFGPLEWVWRTFSYWRWQPLLRESARPVEAPATS